MEQLQQVLKYRFWILAGAAALFSLIGWAVTVSAMHEVTTFRRNQWNRLFTSVRPLTQGDHPNQVWTRNTQQAQDAVEQELDTAWRQLYERQQALLKWPEPVRQEIAELGPHDEIPPDVRAIYRHSAYPAEMEVLQDLVRPYDELEGTGLVRVSPTLVRQYKWETQAPTEEQMRLAQEEIWVYESILTVIDRTNAEAADHVEAPIKAIESLQIARAAGSSRGSGGARARRGASFVDSQGRYLDETDQYRLIPFELSVTMEQMRVPDLLAEFANYELPMAVHYVQWEVQGIERGVPGSAPAAARLNPGSRRDQSVQPRVRVKIYGSVCFYKPPAEKKNATDKGPATAST